MKEKLARLTADSRTRKQRLILALPPCLLFSFFLFLYAPFDLFSRNQDYLWFRYTDLLPGMWILFAATLLLLLGLSLLLRGALANLFLSLVYGAALCLFLQGNYFNGNLTTLTGEKLLWPNLAGGMLINVLAWILILFFLIILLYFSKTLWENIVKVTSCLLILLQVVLMAVAGLPAAGGQTNNRAVIDKGALELSQTKNSVIFVLDTFDTSMMADVMQQAPDIFSQLDGFTYYPNTAGVHSRTFPSAIQYLTGKICEYDLEPKEYIQAAFEESTFFSTLKENGFDIGVYGIDSLLPYSEYHNIDNLISSQDARYLVSSHYGLFSTWFTFMGYRYLPLIAKPFFQLETTDFDRYKGDLLMNGQVYSKQAFSERDFYDALSGEKALSLNSAKGSFRYYHLMGAHYPVILDENFNDVGEDNTTVTKQLRGYFKLISEYVRHLKELGSYDQTNIIITADHGWSQRGNLQMQKSDPIFLMKPINAAGAFQTSQAPVWTMDLRKTILSDLGLDSSKESGMDIRALTADTQRDRYYYHTYLEEADTAETHMDKYKISGDVHDPNNWLFEGSTEVQYTFY